MKKTDFYVDIHCHPTFRAIGSSSNNGHSNHWETTQNQSFDSAASRWARMQTKAISKKSQANFNNLAKGNVRVIVNSLIPVEKGFLQFRKLPTMIVGKKNSDQVLITATGATEKFLKKVRKRDCYFEELLEQYEFLTGGQGLSPCKNYKYQLVRNFQEIENIAHNHADTIAVVPAIEGGHALGCGSPESLKLPLKELRKQLETNIGLIKAWKYPPIWINLVHMFWNQLCGHVRSMKSPMYSAFNQTYGLQKGISELGWFVLQELLTVDNGPRILIDTKHMSIKGRKEYFQFVQRYNYLNKSNKIPIVCSHTGINGFKTMQGSIRKPDRPAKMKKSYFHNWSINISDEEIRIIHESEGILGIMVDKGLLGSSELLVKLDAIEDEKQRRDKFTELILKTIFHIVKVIKQPTAWDIISMGTDYDGVITHIDHYPNASYFPDIERDMLNYIKEHNFQKDLWFGYEPEQIVDKIMRTNAMDFLKRYYV